MADMFGYESTFGNTLRIITSSQIYIDLMEMYETGILQKDKHDQYLISFHKEALGIAGSTAEAIALKGHRLDDIIDADIAVKRSNAAAKDAEVSLAREKQEKDLLLLDAQIAVANQRKTLLAAQERGFDDNVVIERTKVASEAIGMIESGGNDAPQNLWNEWSDAISDLKTISEKHSELTGP